MIATQHLFRPLNQELLSLLRSLSAEDWCLPTVAGQWRVKEVVAHVLDGMLRRLSFARDGYQIPSARPIDSGEALLAFVDELNAEGVKAAARYSPQVLQTLLGVAGEDLAEHFASLDPHAAAYFPVSWTGQKTSPQWLDIGREYTEHWHHQQQIRLATGKPQLLDRRFGYPALAIFMFAVPFAYRDTQAAEGTELQIEILGEAGSIFTLHRQDAEWSLAKRRAIAPAARLAVHDADAWLLFTKGLLGDAAASAVEREGPAELTAPFLRSLAIIG